jgi:hypothetical protein
MTSSGSPRCDASCTTETLTRATAWSAACCCSTPLKRGVGPPLRCPSEATRFRFSRLLRARQDARRAGPAPPRPRRETRCWRPAAPPAPAICEHAAADTRLKGRRSRRLMASAGRRKAGGATQVFLVWGPRHQPGWTATPRPPSPRRRAIGKHGRHAPRVRRVGGLAAAAWAVCGRSGRNASFGRSPSAKRIFPAQPGTLRCDPEASRSAAIPRDRWRPGMAGAGFEPAKAEPMRLQRIPFDRSGTPPGGGQFTEPRLGDGDQRMIGLDFVGRVLRPAEPDARAAVDGVGGDEPPPSVADVDEEEVTTLGAEVRDEAVPAPVPALVDAETSTEDEAPPSTSSPAPARGGRRSRRRDRRPAYGRAARRPSRRAHEPAHGRQLTDVPLQPR